MKKIIRLKESDLQNIVKRVLSEQTTGSTESSLGNSMSRVKLDSGVEIGEEYVGDYKKVKLEITGPRKEVREVNRNLRLNGFILVGNAASSARRDPGEVTKVSQTGEYLVPKDFDYTTL
jgi:hypothetical protein